MVGSQFQQHTDTNTKITNAVSPSGEEEIPTQILTGHIYGQWMLPVGLYDEPYAVHKNWPSCKVWEKEEFPSTPSFISQECVTAYRLVSTR